MATPQRQLNHRPAIGRVPREHLMRVRDQDKLRRTRKERDLTQRQLGALCNVTGTTIYLIETGQLPSVTEDLAILLVKRLGLPLEDVFDTGKAAAAPVIANDVHAVDDTREAS